MKKILFFVVKNGVRTKTFIDELNKELKGIEIVVEEYKNVSVEASQSSVLVKIGEQSLDDFDLVYFRKAKGNGSNFLSLTATLAVYLDKKGIPYFDSVFGKIGIGTKLLPLVKLGLNDLPIPHSYYCSLEDSARVLPMLVNKFCYPFISKHIFLQKLKGVYIIKNEADFEKLLALGFESYIFQEFIEVKEEYRFLVLGSAVEAIHTKTKRSYENLGVGYVDVTADFDYVNIDKFPQELKSIVVKAVRLLNLEIAGVDGVVDTQGKFWIVEVNRGPGLYEQKNDYPAVQALAKFFTKQLR